MLAVDNELTHLVHREIQAAGPLSCARFMELVLYHPVHGYYHQGSKQIGCQGDFYTSVSVGVLFGRLLAFQCAQWLDQVSELASDAAQSPFGARVHGAGQERPNHGATIQLLEAGADDAQLALDILTWLQEQRSDLLSRIEYWILEPSAGRQSAQRRRLESFSRCVRWFTDWGQMPHPVSGVIFSNELLDAFPVFRLGWDARRKTWFEWCVCASNERLQWTRSPVRSAEVIATLRGDFFQTLPEDLLKVLPDGYTFEISPAARVWWQNAAAALNRGYLFTLDYGLETHELLAPHRQHGTLRSYRKHQLSSDLLARPGDQDLTAHVNFSEIQEAGHAAGLQTVFFGSQTAFLVNILAQATSSGSAFGSWPRSYYRQWQTLTHPDHLGRGFRVLVQSRTEGLRGSLP